VWSWGGMGFASEFFPISLPVFPVQHEYPPPYSFPFRPPCATSTLHYLIFSIACFFPRYTCPGADFFTLS
jgi:hypothetical protein